MSRTFSKNWPVIIVFLGTIAFFVYFSLPFFHSGFFPTQDDVQVVRIQEMHKEIRSGQFPVRYIDNLGKGGYMLFNYYSPLPYYVGAAYQTIVVRPVKATKIVFLTSLFIGTLGIFVLTKKYTNVLTALLSIFLFLSAAYVGYDIYLRGALAEVWGMMFFPWILWAFLRVREKPTTFKCTVAGVFYALAILSHIAITVIFSLFLLPIVLIRPYTKKSILGIAKSVGIGLALSAFFWLPLLVETQYIMYTRSEYATKQYLVGFLNLQELAGINTNPADVRATLGAGLLLLAVAASVFLLLKKKNRYRNVFIYAFVVLFVSLLLIHPVTKPLWDSVSLLQYLQSPWRFLTIATIYAVFICALALAHIKNWWVQILLVVMVVAYAVILQAQYMRPYTYNDIPEYRAEGACATTTWQDEYFPTWVLKCLPDKALKSRSFPIYKSSVSVTNLRMQNNGRLITFKTRGEGEVIMAKYYFPSWRAEIDGKSTTLHPSTQHGLITFTVPKGDHQVSVRLGSTPIQTIGNILSLIGLGGILIVFWKQSKKLKLDVAKAPPEEKKKK